MPTDCKDRPLGVAAGRSPHRRPGPPARRPSLKAVSLSLLGLSLLAVVATRLALRIAPALSSNPPAALYGLFPETPSPSLPQKPAAAPLPAKATDGRAHFYAVTADGKQVAFFGDNAPPGREHPTGDACEARQN